MPVKAADVKSVTAAEKAYGIETGAPVGNHSVKIERAEARLADGGTPYLFLLFRVNGGDANKRTIPMSFRWFVAREGKDDEQIKKGESFVRQTTMRLLRAAFGNKTEEWPESVLLPSADVNTNEDTAEAFATIADELRGRSIRLKVTDREGSDFQNFSFSPDSEETAFKL